MQRIFAATLLVSLALAGCAGDVPDPSETLKGTGTTLPILGQVGNTTVDRLGPSQAVALYLTADGALSPDIPAAAAIGAGTPATGFAAGLTPLRFVSAPATQAMLVQPQDIVGTFYIDSDRPLVSNGAFDLGLWLGSTVSSAVFTVALHDTVVQPGAGYRYDLALSFGDHRGILVPAGESLELLLAADMSAQGDEVSLLVGGATASNLNLTWQAYNLDPLAGLEAQPTSELSGTIVQGANPVACDVAPGVTSLSHKVKVGAETVALKLDLAPNGALAPANDIDMHLYDGATQVAATATPSASETIFLAAETLSGLQGKELDLVVYACGTGAVPYKVTIEERVQSKPTSS